MFYPYQAFWQRLGKDISFITRRYLKDDDIEKKKDPDFVAAPDYDCRHQYATIPLLDVTPSAIIDVWASELTALTKKLADDHESYHVAYSTWLLFTATKSHHLVDVCGWHYRADDAAEKPRFEKKEVTVVKGDCCLKLPVGVRRDHFLALLDPPFNLEKGEWDSGFRDDDLKKAIENAKTYLAPECTIAVYGSIEQMGTIFSILKTLDGSHPHTFVVHRERLGYFQGPQIATTHNYVMFSHFGTNKGNREARWFYEKKGEDSFRMAVDSINFAPPNSFSRRGRPELDQWVMKNSTEKLNSTQKSVDELAYIIRHISPPGAPVLSFFEGTGTVSIACLMEGRDVTAVERDEVKVLL